MHSTRKRRKVLRWIMKLSTVIAVLIVFLGLSASLPAQTTRIVSVEPLTAKIGDTVSAKGEGLDSSNVDVLYLTDGTNDFKCDITEQTAAAITFKVPGGVKAGRWALMVHTKKDQLIEQPVKLTVE